jgi:hypothetical protein
MDQLFDKIGIQSNGGFELTPCPVQLAGRLIGPTEAELRHCRAGHERRGFLEHPESFWPLLHPAEKYPQSVSDEEVARCNRYGTAKIGERHVLPAALGPPIGAQIEQHRMHKAVGKCSARKLDGARNVVRCSGRFDLRQSAGVLMRVAITGHSHVFRPKA